MKTLSVKRRGMILLCCTVMILSACPSISPPSGTVIPETQADTPPEKADNLREALDLCSRIVIEDLDADARVAVISIAATDLFEGEYALEELTFLLVRSRKFRIAERRDLDVIRAEQQFQLSGEVDDDTAVFIGHLTGAAFVITGSISRWESEKYLRLRVLDVETGQIKSMTSVSYGGEL